ncbi:aspartoacylase [Glaciecola sp. SC05]|uniref:aspartoacylase n=1 Tax=Glaciecola sp. SC05 TaxID=1987355 RepID=UPI0035276113
MKNKTITICGGTHGNELSGVYAVNHWLRNDGAIRKLIPSAELAFLLVNQASIKARTRFIDEDLNRQFVLNKLQENQGSTSLNCETALAQQLNQQLGPKSAPKTDFIIDIHNTTSAMGPTLIVLESDAFNRNLARYVKTNMPSANILVEDHIPYLQHPYFCTVGKRSVMVEVGPQAQGALRAKVFQETVEMTEHILAYIESVNTHGIKELSAIQAFRLLAEVPYPVDTNGQRSAMIHPDLDANDFSELINGAPCFIDFHGNDIAWQGDTIYPHFIGEAAYDKQGLAFASATVCEF